MLSSSMTAAPRSNPRWAGQAKNPPARPTSSVLSAGGILVIIICFMAVTSSGASEMLAVSSLFTFDVYRRYINPKVGCYLYPCSRSPLAVMFQVHGVPHLMLPGQLLTSVPWRPRQAVAAW